MGTIGPIQASSQYGKIKKIIKERMQMTNANVNYSIGF